MKLHIFVYAILLSVQQLACEELPDFLQIIAGGKPSFQPASSSVPFIVRDGRVYLEANYHDEAFEMLVDTHSPCVLNWRAALLTKDSLILDKSKDLGSVFSPLGLIPEFHLLDSLSFGDVKFFEIGALSMDYQSNSAISNIAPEGIVGSNLLRHKACDFNFENSTLTFTNVLDEKLFGGHTNIVPFTYSKVQYSPLVTMIADGDTIEAQFDTGSSGSINALSPSIRAKIESGQAVKWTVQLEIPVNRDDADSIETHFFVLLDSLQIGNRVYHDVPIIAYNPEYSQLMGRGSIGMQFISSHRTTIDWSTSNIYLMQEVSDEGMVSRKSFGFTYAFDAKGCYVKSIVESYPPEKEGIKIGDRIYAINEHPVIDLAAEDLRLLKEGKIRLSSADDQVIKICINSLDRSNQYVFKKYDLFDF